MEGSQGPEHLNWFDGLGPLPNRLEEDKGSKHLSNVTPDATWNINHINFNDLPN